MEAASLRSWTRSARDRPQSFEDRAERALAARRRAWNAYREFRGDALAQGARWAADALRVGSDLGPLLGVLVSVKDLYGVWGHRTYAGTSRPLPPRFESEGPVIRALRHRGGLVTGKTHTVELAFGGLGANGHWGTPYNPWDARQHRVPGGSSSGAGISLLEGSADLALGTDTAGSIRIPAAFVGVVGLLTAPGRWSTRGIVPLSSTLDSVGLMGRTVDDVAFGFAALDGAFDPRDVWREPAIPDTSAVTLAVQERHLWDDGEAGAPQVVQDALRELELAGCRTERARIPEVGAALRLFGKGSVTAVECLSFLRRQLPTWEGQLEPNVAPRILAAEATSGAEYVRRLARIRRLRQTAAQRVPPGTVVASPTVVSSAPSLDEIAEPGAYRRANLRALRNTSVANTLGWCALSIPCGLDARRLPVGLMLMAPSGREAELLSIGLRVERLLGTAHARFGPVPG